jgi:hypothetical protein
LRNDSAPVSTGPPPLDARRHAQGAGPAVVAAGSLQGVQQRLGQLTQQIHRLQRTLRLTIEAEFAQWTGQSYGSLSANQDVARLIQQTVDGYGLRLRCPECGHAAIMRCSARPGVPEGVFVFDHCIEGRRTFHGGGATLPALQLVAKPLRRRTAG